MAFVEENDLALYERVERTIAENARKMIYDLNEKWKILGVERKTRHIRTENLISFVQERYDEVVDETDDKLRIINEEIQKLQSEMTELSLSLNININVAHSSDESLKMRKDSLESQLTKFRSIMKIRTDKIRSLNTLQDNLHRLIGCKKLILTESPLASEREIELFEEYLVEQDDEYKKRKQIFLEKQRAIKSLMCKLEQSTCDSFQRSILESSGNDFILTDSNLAHLVLINETLEDQLERKIAQITEMRERLELLWQRLDEPINNRNAFLNVNQGYSRITEEALVAEIERCEERKRQSFKAFISKLREEIETMWDKCLYSDCQKEKYADFYYDVFNDELLTSHEVYLDKLRKFYEDNKPIFELYATRQHLWLKMKELEEKSKDSKRFQNRGGQLLREEKERKTVNIQLPKIEEELRNLAEEYESKTGSCFTVFGHNIIQTMQEDWDKENEERHTKMSARKNKAIPTPKPMSASRSAPSCRRLQPALSKNTLTAIKCQLSPRTPQNQISARRLQFTPNLPVSPSKSAKAKRLKAIPTLSVNGYLLKKKVVGRRSRDSKEKRRSQRSSSKTPSKTSINVDSSVASYSNFQEHLDSHEAQRSSIVPGHNLRSRKTEINKFKPDGNCMKENVSPNCFTKLKNHNFTGFLTPNNNKYNTLGSNLNTPNNKTNIDVFATPARPTGKTPLKRQNTHLAASTSININSPHKLRRSNSSHNLRSNNVSQYPSRTQRMQIKCNLPIII